MGALGGMKDFLDHHPELDASISVDGGFIEGITFDATGYRTQEYHFYGTGGHAYMAFGEMANPLHAAARAVAKIADLQVPRQPKTTYCVSNFHAGTDAAIHAIPAQATVKINFRAQTTEQLEELDQAIEGCVKLGCLEESDRWGKDRIRYDRKTLCDVPAGKQDPHAPIVEAAYAIVEWLGKQPYLVQGGSVNGNRAVAKGLPCVSIGLNEFDFKCHSLEEFFPTKEAYLCPQELFLLLLMLAGSEADPSVL